MVSLDLGIHSYRLCHRKEKINFDIVWEDCIQEEARVANRDALLKEYDQALPTHTKRRISQSKYKKEIHKEYQPPKKFQRTRGNNQKINYSNFQCFNCGKLWHIVRNCPLKKEEYKKNNKRYNAHLAEGEDEE